MFILNTMNTFLFEILLNVLLSTKIAMKLLVHKTLTLALHPKSESISICVKLPF